MGFPGVISTYILIGVTTPLQLVGLVGAHLVGMLEAPSWANRIYAANAGGKMDFNE